MAGQVGQGRGGRQGAEGAGARRGLCGSLELGARWRDATLELKLECLVAAAAIARGWTLWEPLWQELFEAPLLINA